MTAGYLDGHDSTNRPPVVQRAVILPNPIHLQGPVSVQIEAADPDRNALTFRHTWFVNGRRIEGGSKPTLDPNLLKRGDQVSAEVTAYDGQMEGPRFTVAPVTVGNTPPEMIGVVVEPTGSDRSRFHAVVDGRDIDQDPVTYSFRWQRNSTVVLEGDQGELETASFSRDDVITVEVTPRDQFAKGKPKLSEAILLGNSSPVITSHPPDKFDKGLFSYQVQATDEDKDTLKYELSKAPSGMSIDDTTGMLNWQVDSSSNGVYPVRVVVDDGHGGSATQDFNVSVTRAAS